MKKYAGLIFLIISIIIATVLLMRKPMAISEEEPSITPYVKTMMLIPQTVRASISSQGVISPSSEITLISELNSRINWISLKMKTGSSFQKGDTLLVLDKRDYELALITSESNVLNAKVNLEREKAESDLASKEWKRVGAGEGSSLALRKPQLAQARATYAASEAKLEGAQRNLKRTVFIAPFDGRVRIRNVDLGTIVFPGTILGNIYSTNSFEVRLPITDQDVLFTGLEFNGKQMPKSNQLDVQFFLGDNTFKGKIIRAEAEVDPITRMLSIVAEIKNNMGELRSVIKENLVLSSDVKGHVDSLHQNIELLETMIVREEDLTALFQNYTLNLNIIRDVNDVQFARTHPSKTGL